MAVKPVKPAPGLQLGALAKWRSRSGQRGLQRFNGAFFLY
jgi:hypothetical protein